MLFAKLNTCMPGCPPFSFSRLLSGAFSALAACLAGSRGTGAKPPVKYCEAPSSFSSVLYLVQYTERVWRTEVFIPLFLRRDGTNLLYSSALGQKGKKEEVNGGKVRAALSTKGEENPFIIRR